MNRERIKMIVHNMELLVQGLKDELNETPSTSPPPELEEDSTYITPYDDYDEVFVQ